MNELGAEANTVPEPSGEMRDALAAGSPAQRRIMGELRSLVYEVTSRLDGIGTIEESLKWGQPTFSTVRPKSGSPFRLAPLKNGHQVALYFICTTSLVSGFRERYDVELTFEGNRAILLACDEPLPREPIKHCIAMALTYHKK